MTAIAPPIESSSTLAQRAAAHNWSANVAALRSIQSELPESLPNLPRDLDFVFARDGALTAISGEGNWWRGCSLPRRAAQAILKTLDSKGRISCFLSPPHAAQIRVALDALRSDQAIVVLVPESTTLAVMLRCEDFSEDIWSHRLLFARGTRWNDELAGIFESNPGLPTPEQFVRGAAADHSETDALIPIAQKVFAAQTTRRVEQVAALRGSWRATDRPSPRVCLVAPSHFHLWEDGGNVLTNAFAGAPGEACDIVRFDIDDPTSAAPLALAERAHDCDAIVSLNLSRADLPDVLPREMPWITWLVRERVPHIDSSGPRDALLVADPRWRSDAIAKGWPAERVEIAFWPALEMGLPETHGGFLALAANTQSLNAPAQVVDMSSQHLLWDAIAAEIADDPFAVTPDAGKYLRRRQREMQIPDEGFDQACFLDWLITPTFQQSIARLLMKAQLPIRVFGKGWKEIEAFSAIAAGPISSRDELNRLVTSADALIYAWPIPRAHPIDAIHRPVLRPALGRTQFLNAARLALQGRLQPNPSAQRVLRGDQILAMLQRLRIAP